jgi:hypothetical protein
MRLIFSFALFGLLVLSTGCGTPTSPSSGTPQWGALNTVSGLRVTTHGDSIYGRALAQFWDANISSSSYLKVNSVTMNGHPLAYTLIQQPNGPVSAYVFDDTSVYNDSTYRWHVDGGSSGIDSFDTVNYRPAHLRLYAPKPGDTVSKSAGFQIAWSNTVKDAKVSIEVDDQTLGLDDTGNAMITSDRLPTSQTGAITVYVYRTNIVSKVIGAKGYALTSGSQSAIQLYLKP